MPPKANQNGHSKTKRSPAIYHIFRENEKGDLTPVGDFEGYTAPQATQEFLKAPPSGHKSLADKVAAGEASVVVIADRSFSRITARAEVKTTMKIKVA